MLAYVSDTTNVNSGTGKDGGCCYWAQELAGEECASFVVMCRIHSLERFSDSALNVLTQRIFGPIPEMNSSHSATHQSLQILCFNVRKLTEYFDMWENLDIRKRFLNGLNLM